MRPLSSSRKAHSLIELLITLSIIAVIGAIIIPRFLNVRDQAESTTISALKGQVQHAYDQWISMGGSVTGTPNSPDDDTPAAFLQLITIPNRTAGGPGITSGPITLADPNDPTTALSSNTLNLSITVSATNNGLMNNLLNKGKNPSGLATGFYYLSGGGKCAYISASGGIYEVQYDSSAGFVFVKKP